VSLAAAAAPHPDGPSLRAVISCMLDYINEWQGRPASWIDTRWTGVLEKRDGRWRMVQMHFSNPVSE